MDNKNFGYLVGKTLGGIFLTCIAACLAAIFIALTIKFIGWIF